MPRYQLVPALVALMSLAVSTTQATAEVELPQVISSHMVLQRDMPLPIWGTAAPGEKVTVSFRGQEKSATAGPEGKWRVRLDPLEAGGPDAMKIAGSNTITLKDVLVGEVWVGSGQSNMDLPVSEAIGLDPVLAAAAGNEHPRIRLLVTDSRGWKAGAPWTPIPPDKIIEPSAPRWQEATPANTAMVTSSDLGPKNHPDNKSGYGARAARVALGMVYGRQVEIYGPAYDSHKIEGDEVRVRFSHVGQGLAWKHGDKLQGFAIAGEDKVFHWADASIDGDTVVVSSGKVKKPVAVRYGWGKEYPWANLFNKAGLPALPLRTDDWE